MIHFFNGPVSSVALERLDEGKRVANEARLRDPRCRSCFGVNWRRVLCTGRTSWPFIPPGALLQGDWSVRTLARLGSGTSQGRLGRSSSALARGGKVCSQFAGQGTAVDLKGTKRPRPHPAFLILQLERLRSREGPRPGCLPLALRFQAGRSLGDFGLAALHSRCSGLCLFAPRMGRPLSASSYETSSDGCLASFRELELAP